MTIFEAVPFGTRVDGVDGVDDADGTEDVSVATIERASIDLRRTLNGDFFGCFSKVFNGIKFGG